MVSDLSSLHISVSRDFRASKAFILFFIITEFMDWRMDPGPLLTFPKGKVHGRRCERKENGGGNKDRGPSKMSVG